MKVSHKRSVEAPILGTFSGDALCYRTEVLNSTEVDIKIVWFQFFIEEHGSWCGYTVKNRVLREADFLQAYHGGDAFQDGWILPGHTAVCDPNWHGGDLDHFPRVKWSFLAVDREGETYFDEAEVAKECVSYIHKSAE